ncbi:hypothetical protein CMI49_00370 [Candidatus Pacearchaeota archaeon]|jgi:cellulose synthase/poly-beta-1,6-N-acetylglucosamine synthase-like glycosyltransferase|nr:hypothetical protein [Candidatus Pacearchaeota archaeon]|tara:strand:+ start:25229 stop:26134 length:906 start_codon:yes stop_codon:yes gene_type:complete
MIKLDIKLKMISIIITSFNEPRTIGKAIESFLQQNIKEKYELIVSAPDKKTHDVVRKYKEVKLFKDKGKGKSYALNSILPKLKGEIIILTDGDVFVSQNSVDEILKYFKDKTVGCVSGRPRSIEPRNTILGYWSHVLVDAGAHELRKKRAKKGEFLECSGYLWAFRNYIIKKFPIDTAEDTIVPIMFYLKGYKIGYAPNSEVYVRYPNKFNDFIKQKIRAAASHDTLSRYVNPRKIPRMKTFANEIFDGFRLFYYPKDLKEFIFTLLLFPARFYIWLNLFYNSKVKDRKYSDAWKRIESTK